MTIKYLSVLYKIEKMFGLFWTSFPEKLSQTEYNIVFVHLFESSKILVMIATETS